MAVPPDLLSSVSFSFFLISCTSFFFSNVSSLSLCPFLIGCDSLLSLNASFRFCLPSSSHLLPFSAYSFSFNFCLSLFHFQRFLSSSISFLLPPISFQQRIVSFHLSFPSGGYVPSFSLYMYFLSFSQTFPSASTLCFFPHLSLTLSISSFISFSPSFSPFFLPIFLLDCLFRLSHPYIPLYFFHNFLTTEIFQFLIKQKKQSLEL